MYTFLSSSMTFLCLWTAVNSASTGKPKKKIVLSSNEFDVLAPPPVVVENLPMKVTEKPSFPYCSSYQKKPTDSDGTNDCFMVAFQWCNKKWTAHGLWYQGHPPCDINNPILNNQTHNVATKPEANTLLTYFPSCMGYSAQSLKESEAFWIRQWNKHGYCVNAPDLFKNSLEYVLLTARLAQNNQAAIQSRFNIFGSNQNNEVVLCFDRSLKNQIGCVV